MENAVQLSECLENSFKAVDGSVEVSSLTFAKTICKQHDASGKEAPYADIRKIDEETGAYLHATPDQWQQSLTGACSSEAKILHTNLALLLLARMDPRLATDFAPTIDAQLREDLFRLLADYTNTHEIRGHAEFVELLDNVRKWQPKHKQMEGRRRTAVLYSADRDLSGWAATLQQLQGHAYLGFRFRVPASDATDVLAKWLRKALESADSSGEFSPVEHYMRDTAEGEQMRKELGDLLPSEPDLAPLIAALRRGLHSAGPRLILFVELEGEPGQEAVTAAQQLGSLFAGSEEDEGRLTIVIGGVPHGSLLNHAPGASVYRLEATPELEDTGQTWKNDLAQGEDLLNIKQEAAALADGIASKELQPPLVVGICGGWGGGKSFVLHLIEQHLKQIRQAIPKEDSLYVGHIYWIEFDAWYYSKQNIWASLMDRILSELERQMNIERIMARGNSQLPEDKVSWEITRELTDREIEELTKDKAWKARLYEAQKGEMRLLLDPAEERLKKEINEFEKDLKLIEEQKEDLQKKERDAQKEAVTNRRRLDKQIAEHQRELDQIREKYLAQHMAPKFVETAKNQFSNYLLERIGIEPNSFKALKDQDQVRDLLSKKDFSRLLRIAKASPTVWGFALALLASLGAVAWGLWKNQDAGVFFGLPAAIFSVWSVVRSTFDQMLDGTKQTLQAFGERYEAEKDRVELVRVELSAEFDNEVEATPAEVDEDADDEVKQLSDAKRARQAIVDAEVERAEDVEKPMTEGGRTEADLEAAAQKAREQIEKKQEQLSQSISDNPGLVDFLQSIRSMGSYRMHLGLLDTAQHHLKELSRILVYTANNRVVADDTTTTQGAESAGEVPTQPPPFIPFDRGSPRIVLVIDDLDRCPPSHVVTVLEAAQLLMKTELFVVLMAIDLRYITRALEKVYCGILAHESHPTGLDYIEKIIQLPYRVREVSPEQLRGFFAENLDVAAETSTVANTGGGAGMGSPQGGEQEQQQLGRVVEIPAPEVKKETLQLSLSEFQDLVDACKYLSLSPRSAKRITNVYKIWKLIWHRRGVSQQNSPETRVMVALLAISTVRPRLVRNGLFQMNATARIGRKHDQELQGFFHDVAVRLMEPPHILELLTEGRLLPASFKLSELTQSNLNLLSSFSFVGDDESSEPETSKEEVPARPDLTTEADSSASRER